MLHVSLCPGKRIESLRKYLEQVFSECSWRQPAVILLDDLDLIAAAPAGPEQEMGGEAMYYMRVAECGCGVVTDINIHFFSLALCLCGHVLK